ncbi:MAG: molybdopterin biosynthesis protein [Clostridia bacterium]|nr:molybdopterin biosynthesis protein [Clostridia bacterium]
MERNTYIENNDFEESLKNYLANIHSMDCEEIPTINSTGRITAKAVFAFCCDPTYNASAMDGVAVFSESTLSASETTPLTLKKEQYEYVNTGGVIAPSFDSVIMIEDVIVLNDNEIQIIAPSRPWQQIRVVGESVVATEMILPSHRKIRPIDLGAILASGNETVSVFKMPRVAILPTGNEMVEHQSELEEGKLMESNTRVFSALVTEYGGIPNRFAIVKDEEQLLEDTIKTATIENDIVIINAGSSAGTKDFTAQTIAKLGEVKTHGLAIKPGKPTILGFIKEKPVIGVPGYPVSAYIVFDKVVKAVVEKMTGQTSEARQTVKATLTKRLTSTFKNKEFVRVALGDVGGKIVASPLERGAAAVMSMIKADGLLTIERNSEGIEVGEEVEVELFKPLAEIRRSLVIVGSHDPIIDLISDKIAVSSAHVGSLSGIMALRRGAAHIAPIHLLHAESGVYNIPFVKQYFESGTMALIKGLGRVQGIVVPKNNPKNISSISQLKGGKFSFANRQNGAGTRLLFDFLLQKEGIEKDEIKGYDKEFTTHLAVATAVKSGVCDCGLAVLSAANIMDLDFISIGNESYDFLLPKTMLDDVRVKNFIEVLKSKSFKEQVENIGGYTFENIGSVEVVE